MKNIKKISISFLILSAFANSIFAYQNVDEIQEKVKRALGQSQEVKSIIKEEVKKQVEEEVKKIKKEVIKAEIKKENLFFEKLKKAKNESERKLVLLEFNKENTLKSEDINQKIENIFSKFDFIINKLNKVNSNLRKEILNLETNGVKLDFTEKKEDEIVLSLANARKFEILAWLKMQNINFNSTKEELLLKLKEVKKDLLQSKIEIKKASSASREMILFIRGALVSLKK